jgi:hypothetical protein
MVVILHILTTHHAKATDTVVVGEPAPAWKRRSMMAG